MTHDNRTVPQVYQEFRDQWADPQRRAAAIELFASGARSFVPNVLPEQALALAGTELLEILRARYGAAVDLAIDQTNTDVLEVATLPAELRGSYASQSTSSWLKRSNMVGINVRTVGNFWNIVKYALTLPAAQDSIHLLPIWEPGVVGSMYGMSSWQLNPEFFSAELAELCPWLDTTERQLRATVNLLHVSGRAVGMDVIPHTDRFSEMVLSYPEHFEWLQRQDTVIISHSSDLYISVQEAVFRFLQRHDSAVANEKLPDSAHVLFSDSTPEDRRLRLLFGTPEDRAGRDARRNQLIAYLTRYGYEPVPATMAPPFRGLQVDLRPEARTIDGSGTVWREYVTSKPTGMSRVFGPLARYKLYESFDDNAEWALDFSCPSVATWRYVCDHYAEIQRRYNFDFMRGDMAHVQMRPNGVPDSIDAFYDILGAVKHTVQANGTPHFGYFAETFLGPRDVFGYGEEIDHLEAADADTTLGDLQSTVLGTAEFLRRFRYYEDLHSIRSCTPAFTVMTADKDDPRFDLFYRTGNEARLFISLLLADTPSYMGLGFETRDIHPEPAPNEHYTKLYVFQESDGPKATRGPYVWGRNGALYNTITQLKIQLDTIWPLLQTSTTRWLSPPDATGENPIVAWTQVENPQFVFVVNTSAERSFTRVGIPFDGQHNLSPMFSTHTVNAEAAAPLIFNGKQHILPQLAPGEAIMLRVE